MNKEQALLAVVAIVCITVLEVLAMHYGIDGALFGLAVAAIAGISGWEIHKKKKK